VTFSSSIGSTDYRVALQSTDNTAGVGSGTCQYVDVSAKTTTGFTATLRTCNTGAVNIPTTAVTFDYIAILSK
jgi:hypothetical protein